MWVRHNTININLLLHNLLLATVIFLLVSQAVCFMIQMLSYVFLSDPQTKSCFLSQKNLHTHFGRPFTLSHLEYGGEWHLKLKQTSGKQKWKVRFFSWYITAGFDDRRLTYLKTAVFKNHNIRKWNRANFKTKYKHILNVILMMLRLSAALFWMNTALIRW